MLIEWVEQDILTMQDIYFDIEQIENFIQFADKWYFPLEPFQKFLTCFIFLRYKDSDDLVFNEFFIYMARGAGNNGFVSALVNYFISELHGIDFYNVSIVANSEKQAKTSFTEVYNAIDMNDALKYTSNFKRLLSNLLIQNQFFSFIRLMPAQKMDCVMAVWLMMKCMNMKIMK